MKWSDGQPATAWDASFTYSYLLGSLGKPDELIVGNNSTADMQNVESVTAIDDETLQIVLRPPLEAIDNFVDDRP